MNARLAVYGVVALMLVISWLGACVIYQAAEMGDKIAPLDPREFPSWTVVAVGTGGGYEVGNSSHLGMIFGNLVPAHERERSVFDIIEAARADLSKVPGRTIRIYNPGEMMSMGQSGGFEVEIRGHLSLAELDALSEEMIARLERLGGFVDLDKSLKLGQPELKVVPDRERAAALAGW